MRMPFLRFRIALHVANRLVLAVLTHSGLVPSSHTKSIPTRFSIASRSACRRPTIGCFHVYRLRNESIESGLLASCPRFGITVSAHRDEFESWSIGFQ